MRILSVFLFLLFVNLTSAQNYFGYLSDNYSGLHSVTLNPANITSSKFRTEVNIVSANASFNNDYFVFDFNDLFKGTNVEDTNFLAKENNNFAISADVMGPSFMFNLSPKHSIGIITRARSYFNVNKIKGELFDAFEDDFDSENDFTLSEDEFTSTLHGWAELGIVYGRTLIDKDKHYLKAGVTLKYLQGAGNAYTKGSNLLVNFDADGFSSNIGSIASTGQIEYGTSQGLSESGDDFEIESGSNGFGVDLGFIYEWKPEATDLDNDSRSNYKLKLGLSITDIGSINYNNANANTYDITNVIDEDTYQSQEGIEDKLNNLYTKISSEDFTKVKLPTALHITADYNFNTQFFVNLRTDLSLRKASDINTNKVDNSVVVTPRFERKWFSVFVPLSVMNYSGFNAGFGFRAGPLFVGSNTLLTNLMSSNSKATNAYVGLKIPIYKKGKSAAKTESTDNI